MHVSATVSGTLFQRKPSSFSESKVYEWDTKQQQQEQQQPVRVHSLPCRMQTFHTPTVCCCCRSVIASMCMNTIRDGVLFYKLRHQCINSVSVRSHSSGKRKFNRPGRGGKNWKRLPAVCQSLPNSNSAWLGVTRRDSAWRQEGCANVVHIVTLG